MARGDVVLRRFLPKGKKLKDAKRVHPAGGHMKSAFGRAPSITVGLESEPSVKAPAKKAPARKKKATKKAAAKKDT